MASAILRVSTNKRTVHNPYLPAAKKISQTSSDFTNVPQRLNISLMFECSCRKFRSRHKRNWLRHKTTCEESRPRLLSVPVSSAFTDPARSESSSSPIHGEASPTSHPIAVPYTDEDPSADERGNDRSYDETKSLIKGLLLTGMKPDRYVKLFHPIATQSKDFLGTLYKSYKTWFDESYEHDLIKLQELGKNWIENDAGHDIDKVPGNFRRMLVNFISTDEVTDDSFRILFTMRENVTELRDELSKILRFIFRHPSGKFLIGWPEDWETNTSTIPLILNGLVGETPPNLDVHPVIVEYCVSRCLRYSDKEGLKMVGYSHCSKTLACVLHLLRSGVCSKIAKVRENVDVEADKLVTKARTSRSINILCPWIRQFRHDSKSKPPPNITTLDEDGKISINGTDIPKSEWSKSIPNLASQSIAHLMAMVNDKTVLKVLNVSTPIEVERDNSNNFQFWWLGDRGEKLHSDSIILRDVASDNNLLDLMPELKGMIAVMFHGFGGGSMRLSEVERLEIHDAVWHRQTIYYHSQPKKTGNYKHPTHDPIWRKLPATCARIFLVFHVLHRQMSGHNEATNQLLPNLAKKDFGSMQEAFAQLFNLTKTPNAIQIRHIWGAVLNVCFGKGTAGSLLTVNDNVARMMGHSGRTHLETYSTVEIGKTEEDRNLYHRALGYAETDVMSLDGPTEENALAAMRLLFGENGKYMTRLQESAVLWSLEQDQGHHLFVGTRCGGGKSLSWTVPVVASRLARKRIGTIIVVVPYQFLADCHAVSTRRLLRSVPGVDIQVVQRSEISNIDFPEFLSETDRDIPDLVFTTVDAIDAIVEFHLPRITALILKNQVHRFFIDEVHTLLTENYRSSYSSLQQITKLAIPTAVLSGSIPRSLISPICRFLRLTANDTHDDMLLLTDTTVTGNFPRGFHISVTNTDYIEDDVVAAVRRQLELLPSSSVHVICSTIFAAEDISRVLSKEGAVILTSQTPTEARTDIAARWSTGSIDVLISTTCALVGNENSRCHSVLVAGTLYCLIDIVQALNRLRISQRIPNGVFSVFVKKYPPKHIRPTVRAVLDYSMLNVEQRTSLETVGSLHGVYEWLSHPDCRIKKLNAAFSISVNNCGCCDHCNARPVVQVALLNSMASDKEDSIACEAERILRLMKRFCIVCNSTACNGEQCALAGGTACFKCLGRHMRHKCKFVPQHCLQGKACYYCFDLFDRANYQKHSTDSCHKHLDRRLKRLMVAAFHIDMDCGKEIAQNDDGTAFQQFIQRTYASRAIFYKNIVNTYFAMAVVEG